MIPWVPSALINHLWQSTLFVIVVWVAALVLRNDAARVRCWLWTAASIKFLVPLAVLVSLGEQLQWRTAPAAVQPAVTFVMEEVLAPATVVVAAVPAATPQASPIWPWLLVALWCAGAAVVLLSWWRQWLPIRAALRRATPVRLDAEYGVDDLSVMSSPAMPEPAVVGIRRPRLLLPDGILERLTPAQLRALIAHERCHIRYRDNLTAAIHMAVEAMFWFHPAVWWIESRLLDERERACDEAVLQSGNQPRDYAEGILEVCRQSVGLRLACVAGVSGSNLRARVEAIMRNEIGRPLTRGRRWALTAAVVAAVAGPVAAGALTIQSQVVVPAALAFETAAIKPADPRRGPSPPALAMEASFLKAGISRSQDGRFNAESPVHVLIQAAYSVSSLQVEGGPTWVALDRYEIHATAAGPATPDEMRGMLQSLLAGRFKLALRRETRTLPVYELVVAGGGLKIAAMKAGECIPPKGVRWDLLDWEAPRYFCDTIGRRTLSQDPETRPLPRWPRVTRFEGGNVSMLALIDAISGDAGRVVIDKTGFTPRFNLVLDFASAADPSASGPTIFTALQEQLGLELRATSAPVEMLVIDLIERPSSN